MNKWEINQYDWHIRKFGAIECEISGDDIPFSNDCREVYFYYKGRLIHKHKYEESSTVKQAKQYAIGWIKRFKKGIEVE